MKVKKINQLYILRILYLYQNTKMQLSRLIIKGQYRILKCSCSCHTTLLNLAAMNIGQLLPILKFCATIIKDVVSKFFCNITLNKSFWYITVNYMLCTVSLANYLCAFSQSRGLQVSMHEGRHLQVLLDIYCDATFSFVVAVCYKYVYVYQCHSSTIKILLQKLQNVRAN